MHLRGRTGLRSRDLQIKRAHGVGAEVYKMVLVYLIVIIIISIAIIVTIASINLRKEKDELNKLFNKHIYGANYLFIIVCHNRTL